MTGSGSQLCDPYPYPSRPVPVTRAGYPDPCNCLRDSMLFHKTDGGSESKPK
jgi:hypothetical protein